jgi:hypothetical protein
MKGVIDAATRTTYKALLLFVPGETELPESVKQHAKERGVRIIVIPVPWLPEYVPKLDQKADPNTDPKATAKQEVGK